MKNGKRPFFFFRNYEWRKRGVLIIIFASYLVRSNIIMDNMDKDNDCRSSKRQNIIDTNEVSTLLFRYE